MVIKYKIADKIKDLSKKFPKELHSKKFDLQNENEIKTTKETYISPEKRQQIIDELRLV